MNGEDGRKETPDLADPAGCSPSDWQSELTSCLSIPRKVGLLRACWLRVKDLMRVLKSWRARRAYRSYLKKHPEFAQFVRMNREILETVDHRDTRYH